MINELKKKESCSESNPSRNKETDKIAITRKGIRWEEGPDDWKPKDDFLALK